MTRWFETEKSRDVCLVGTSHRRDVAFINAEKTRWPVEVQCDVFGVSRSGYYAWKGRPEAPRTREDAEVVIEIKLASELGRVLAHLAES